MAALIADGASEPWRVSMAPPPGLADESMPAKVPMSGIMEGSLAARCGASAGGASGEWVNAVLRVAPYLNAQQIHHALSILDRAIINTQQAKAFEKIAAGAYHSGLAMPGMPYPGGTFELLRMQVCEQQRALLAELHRLHEAAGVPPGSAGIPGGFARGAPPTAAPVPVPMPPAAQQHAPLGHRRDAAAVPEPPGFAGSPVGGSSGGERLRPSGGRQVQTLSTSLQLLSHEDPDCLFIVRRINKLGFKAARKLKHHFSAYGSIVRVLVAHSTVRQHGDPQCHARRRPSSLGFVHMATAEAVRKVLMVGSEQEVDGSFIRVQRFERQHGEVIEEEEDEEGGKLAEEQERLFGDPLLEVCWERQQTASTTASTHNSAESEAQASDSSFIEEQQ